VTKKFKDFGRPVKQDELEPVAFDLYGQTFNCYKQIHGVTLLRFVKEANSEDGTAATNAMLDIFKRVMPKDEYTKFESLCEDPDTVVPVETLGEIIAFLMEAYTGKDLQESKDS
jgi:hypothetical protein